MTHPTTPPRTGKIMLVGLGPGSQDYMNGPARAAIAEAYADFVVALYNQKSGRRTRQIQEAQRIFLRHRDPKKPVAIVKSASRPKQSIEFTTLEKLHEAKVSMLSTVLIGNSNTYVKNGLVINHAWLCQ